MLRRVGKRARTLGRTAVRYGIGIPLVALALAGCGIVAPAEGFDVGIGPAGASIPRQRAGAFLVSIEREEGFVGAVDLSLRDAPVGIAAVGGVEAGEAEGELLVRVGRDAALGPVMLRFDATARSGTGLVLHREVALMVTILEAQRPTLHLTGAAGSPPPAVVYEEIVVPEHAPAYRLELVVLAGALVLEPDGRYEHLLTIDTLQDGRLVGRARWSDHGLWAEEGGVLTFASTWIDGHAFNGVRSGADVTIDFDLHPFAGTHASAELVFAE